ncbi:12938765-8b37-419b-921e-b20a6496ef6b [Thermothielavioides terrestris]|uniref:12938765-8b37-419b-921e-b20a6496ef6b n=1 Tax=Thermothielavioides terrestris TaxID=2587410 RepID=A0A3S4F265_9PEZI|nr:12938765-8b37-419b-921e-b20a6496ef6b [Thermothielavioides terrestris]
MIFRLQTPQDGSDFDGKQQLNLNHVRSDNPLPTMLGDVNRPAQVQEIAETLPTHVADIVNMFN